MNFNNLEIGERIQMIKYLTEIPKTLQEDFAENKVVPQELRASCYP